ncbi:MAG: metallophosphoesterase [Angustibacter sp.]
MKTIIIIGDTGGNPDVLKACLSDAGAQIGRIPANRLVVHVGDVIRCHPKFRSGNHESMEIVCELQARNPDSYIQLMGNHESAALGGPSRTSWNTTLSVDKRTTGILHSMWRRGALRLAIGLTTVEMGDVLITHAGLTRSHWLELGAPGTAAEAAEKINRNHGRDLHSWARAGRLVGMEDPLADVTWAEVIRELSLPWISAGDSPFSQIHGHASPYNWQTADWWPDAPLELRANTAVDMVQHRTTTQLSSTTHAVSVDWNLGDLPLGHGPTWPLLTLNILDGVWSGT